MIPKSGNRFSEKIMLVESMIPKKPAPGLDPGVGTGFRKRSCSNLVATGRGEFGGFQIADANLGKQPLDIGSIAERSAGRQNGGGTRGDRVAEGILQPMIRGKPRNHGAEKAVA